MAIQNPIRVINTADSLDTHLLKIYCPNAAHTFLGLFHKIRQLNFCFVALIQNIYPITIHKNVFIQQLALQLQTMLFQLPAFLSQLYFLIFVQILQTAF